MEPPNPTQTVAKAVSRALSGAGISQRSASASTGIPLTTLSRRLTGFSPFTVTELAALAGLLGMSVSSLIEHTDEAA